MWIESSTIPTHGIVENVKVRLARYPKIVLIMDNVVVYVPVVWGILFTRNFVATLGSTLHMDLTSLNIRKDDGTYSDLLNMTMKKYHVEEIDIESETKEPPEVEEPLLEFFPDDFPFTIEKYFNAID